MRNIFLWACASLFVVFLGNTFVACQGCSDRKVDDISEVPGIYKGQATLQIPENLMKLVPDSLKVFLNTPITAKLSIRENDEQKLTLEVVDFKMPQGMVMRPSSCVVSQEEKVFNLEGVGEVALPDQKTLPYEYEGRIEDVSIQVDGTIYIIPKLLGIKMIFRGEKC